MSQSQLATEVLESLRATTTNVIENKVDQAQESFEQDLDSINSMLDQSQLIEQLNNQIRELKHTQLEEAKSQLKKEIYKEVKSRMEKAVPKQKKSTHLFFTPTMIGITYALWISIQPNLANAIDTGQWTRSFWFDTFSKLFAAVATLALRGSEGSTAVYTNHFLPGLNKEDLDDNNNSIPDYLE